MRFYSKCLLIFVCSFLCCNTALCEELLQSKRLQQISNKIASLESERATLAAEMLANDKLLAQLGSEIKSVQANIASGKNELVRLEAVLEDLSSEIQDYSDRQQDALRQSGKRLKAMYVLGGGQQMSLVLASQGKAGLGQISRYMSAIRAHERAALFELKRLGGERLKRVDELNARKQELETLQINAERQQSELRSKQSGLEMAKVTFQKQRASKARILSELRAESLRIETVLSSLVSTEQPKNMIIAEDSEKSLAQVKKEPQVALAPAVDLLSVGFGAPVQGALVAKYGSQVSDGLEQLNKSKGLGYIVAGGKEVRAVATGTASFVGTLGSYGSVVILDHGNRTHTLYSQLASSGVILGGIVQQNDIIGSISALTPGRPYNFYFELRKEGKAIDPKPYLR